MQILRHVRCLSVVRPLRLLDIHGKHFWDRWTGRQIVLRMNKQHSGTLAVCALRFCCSELEVKIWRHQYFLPVTQRRAAFCPVSQDLHILSQDLLSQATDVFLLPALRSLHVSLFSILCSSRGGAQGPVKSPISTWKPVRKGDLQP